MCDRVDPGAEVRMRQVALLDRRKRISVNRPQRRGLAFERLIRDLELGRVVAEVLNLRRDGLDLVHVVCPVAVVHHLHVVAVRRAEDLRERESERRRRRYQRLIGRNAMHVHDHLRRHQAAERVARLVVFVVGDEVRPGIRTEVKGPVAHDVPAVLGESISGVEVDRTRGPFSERHRRHQRRPRKVRGAGRRVQCGVRLVVVARVGPRRRGRARTPHAGD